MSPKLLVLATFDQVNKSMSTAQGSYSRASSPRKLIVVAISGATGTIISIKLLIVLRRLNVETHLIISS
jgi:4-hydroxy-3-polyprenylbenzoate decarboxylase